MLIIHRKVKGQDKKNIFSMQSIRMKVKEKQEDINILGKKVYYGKAFIISYFIYGEVLYN